MGGSPSVLSHKDRLHQLDDEHSYAGTHVTWSMISDDANLCNATYAEDNEEGLQLYCQIAGKSRSSVDFEILQVPSRNLLALLETNHAEQTQRLAIRGGRGFRNYFMSLQHQVDAVPELGAGVHAGFLDASRAMKEIAEPSLVDGYGLRLCGHSLGGAVAFILALLWNKAGRRIIDAVSFCAPRIGKQDLADVVPKDLDLLRIIEVDDLVRA